jgi:hypothetical protein
MNSLHAGIILILTYLSFYFFTKNNIKSFKFLNFNDHFSLQKGSNLKSKFDLKRNVDEIILAKNTNCNKHFLLNKSLKQLEFIADFEKYLDEKTLENLSIEFLQEFEQIKIEAQLITLKVTNQLNLDTRFSS